MKIKDIKRKTENLSLLYIEDNEELRESKLILFREIFGDVEDASNGYEGLKKYQERDFDLIITDINMPIMGGLEMIEKIKKINPDQKVIVHSAYSELEYVSKMINLKIDSFITKPITSKDLTSAISSVVDKEIEISA